MTSSYRMSRVKELPKPHTRSNSDSPRWPVDKMTIQGLTERLDALRRFQRQEDCHASRTDFRDPGRNRAWAVGGFRGS